MLNHVDASSGPLHPYNISGVIKIKNSMAYFLDPN